MFIDYMERLLGPAKWNSAHIEAQWNCPFCGDTRKRFRMNRKSLLAYCFNCDWRGSAIKFLRDYEHLATVDAFDVVNNYQEFTPLPQNLFDSVYENLYGDSLDHEHGQNKQAISLPDDFELLYDNHSFRSRNFSRYARKRGITDHQLITHGIGFCSEGRIDLGNSRYAHVDNHLIVQTFNDQNEPIYWMGRAINNKIKPKAYNPQEQLNAYNKSDVVFNLNNAKKDGFAVINEGVFDAMSVGRAGTAIFGKTLSMRQLEAYIDADLELVYVMLDPDALAAEIKLADTINRYIPTYLCFLHDGDPNEVGRKGCLDAIKHAQKYDQLLGASLMLKHG